MSKAKVLNKKFQNSKVVQDVQTALDKRRRIPAVIGAFLGAVIPFLTWHTAHADLDITKGWLQFQALFCAAGLLYSSLNVYSWGEIAFRNKMKAFGFVLLMEGIMVSSKTLWVSLLVLGYLMIINAVATATNLANPEPVKVRQSWE
jgi:phosphatidylserine synthase